MERGHDSKNENESLRGQERIQKEKGREKCE